MSSVNTSSNIISTYDSANMLRINGLATGLDTDTIIKQLMQAESAPLDSMKQRQQILEWQQADYRAINTAISSLRDASFNMSLQSTYLKYKASVTAADSSNSTSILSASPGAAALEGNYTITISNMATAASLVSTQNVDINPAASLSSQGLDGDINFTITSYQLDSDGNRVSDTPTTVTFSSGAADAYKVDSSMSLNNIISKINNSGLGVNASYDSTLKRLVITSAGTGTNASIDITDNGGTSFMSGTMGLSSSPDIKEVSAAGQDAEYSYTNKQIGATVSGLTSHTNANIKINGTVYTISGTGSADVGIQKDTDAIYDSIKSFIDQYNDTIDTINKMFTEAKMKDSNGNSYLPLTDTQKEQLSETQQDQWTENAKSGILNGDDTLSGIMYGMRNVMSSTVSGQGADIKSIYQLGLSTSSYFVDNTGKIQIDDDSLKKAINNDLDGVIKLFTNPVPDSGDKSQGGIMVQLNDYLDTQVSSLTQKAGSSGALVDNSFMGKEISSYSTRISDYTDRLKTIEDRYYNEFSQLEVAETQMSAQSSWLTQLLSSS